MILVVWLISCSCRLIFPLWVCGRLTIGVIRAIVYWLSSSPSMNSFRFRFLIFDVRRRYCIGRSQTSAQVGFPFHPHPLSPPSSQTEKYFLTSVKGISNKFQKKNLREKKWNWFRYRKLTLRLRVKPCNLNLIQLEILSVQLYILGHWIQRQNLEIILVIHFMTRPARRLGSKFNRNGSRKRWRLIKRIDSTLKNPFKVKRIQLFHFKLHKCCALILRMLEKDKWQSLTR